MPAAGRSVWSRRGVVMISAIVDAEYPDGSGEAGPQWLVSIARHARSGQPSRPSDEECRQAMACLRVPTAEEDNHEPGVSRHFWLPVDPRRRRDCECKETERTVVEADNHRWTTPIDGRSCNGCDYEVMVASLGHVAPCPVHTKAQRP